MSQWQQQHEEELQVIGRNHPCPSPPWTWDWLKHLPVAEREGGIFSVTNSWGDEPRKWRNSHKQRRQVILPQTHTQAHSIQVCPHGAFNSASVSIFSMAFSIFLSDCCFKILWALTPHHGSWPKGIITVIYWLLLNQIPTARKGSNCFKTKKGSRDDPHQTNVIVVPEPHQLQMEWSCVWSMERST